jgi:predicted metal-dependent HD superfamily phosphohydrolase
MGANEQEQARFGALWRRNLATEPGRAEAAYAELAALYSEPHRHYHTLAHIRHCLRQFDLAADLMDQPDAVEMALWFHDAIYIPGAMDNERRSTDLFRAWSAAAGAVADFQESVSALVMATTHRTPPPWQDGQFIVDIDLSSFGLPWEDCEQDGQRIRAECAHLTDDQYYPGHLRFVLALQNRPAFFFTEFFQQRYGQTAQDNINRIVANLAALGYHDDQ